MRKRTEKNAENPFYQFVFNSTALNMFFFILKIFDNFLWLAVFVDRFWQEALNLD